MIRKLEDKDIDKVMNIWLESTIKAHDFISKEYWESNYDTVKEVYIPIADSFIYEEKGNCHIGTNYRSTDDRSCRTRIGGIKCA